MKKEITIKLVFVDRMPDGDEAVEIETVADYVEGVKRYLCYKEDETLGMGNCRVRISWQADSPEKLRIERSGDNASTMYFSPGERLEAEYSLGAGSIGLCTLTERSENTFDGSADGKIDLDYALDLEGEMVGMRTMKIRVLPA